MVARSIAAVEPCEAPDPGAFSLAAGRRSVDLFMGERLRNSPPQPRTWCGHKSENLAEPVDARSRPHLLLNAIKNLPSIWLA